MRNKDYALEVTGTLLGILADTVVLAGVLVALYIIFIFPL